MEGISEESIAEVERARGSQVYIGAIQPYGCFGGCNALVAGR
jgi:hypothetical protein